MYVIEKISKPMRHSFDLEQRNVIALRLVEALNHLYDESWNDPGLRTYKDGYVLYMAIPKCTTVFNVIFNKDAILEFARRLGISLKQESESLPNKLWVRGFDGKKRRTSACVMVLEGIKCFLHKEDRRKWKISEYESGAFIASGFTPTEAQENAIKELQQYRGIITRVIGEFIAKYGVANEVTNVTK